MAARSSGALILGSDFKALAALRSLARAGIPTLVVDSVPRAAWFSRHARGRVRWPSPMAGRDFAGGLLELARTRHLDGWVLLPMQDDALETVAHHGLALRERYRVVTPDWESLAPVHDKLALNRTAERAGVPHPLTWTAADEHELASLDLPFPVIVKPAVSIELQHALGKKALPAENPEQLVAAWRRAARAVGTARLMIQEVIPGDGEAQLSVAAFCEEGTVRVGMTARRRRQFPIDYGLSSSFVEAVEVPELLPMAQRMMAQTRISGPVELEFKRDPRDGIHKLFDVNVRLWAWHALCAACGLDFALMQYEVAEGKWPRAVAPRYGLSWVRVPTDVPAALQAMRRGRLSPGAYLRSLLRPLVFSVLDWRDPLPFLGDVALIALRIRSLLRRV
jgi:D-aspartate ligase